MRICNENKIYMKYSLFWWLNFGTLKQFMMTMPFLTSIQLCLNSLYSDLHLKILLLFVGNQLKAEKVRLAISPLPLQQSKIWLKWSAAGRRPANLRKRNFLVSVNTTDFEKTTIQAHSAMGGFNHYSDFKQSRPIYCKITCNSPCGGTHCTMGLDSGFFEVRCVNTYKKVSFT